MDYRKEIAEMLTGIRSEKVLSGYLYQIFAKILELKQMNSRTAL